MKKFWLGLLMCVYAMYAIAESSCKLEPKGYKIVPHTHLPFSVDGKKACFFAFYTSNPKPIVDEKGEGNSGDAIWYGYYELSNSSKVYTFPKPKVRFWTNICSIETISFKPMSNGEGPAVTILGSCNKNSNHYIYPIVFYRQKNQYVIDDGVYISLHGSIYLTLADIQAYTKAMDYLSTLAQRAPKD